MTVSSSLIVLSGTIGLYAKENLSSHREVLTGTVGWMRL